MLLKSLTLVNFRNYSRTEFNFSPGLNLIIGPNASGKTNLLEAVYLLATGDSFRASKNEQMIGWQKDSALIEAETDDHQLRISLAKKDGRVKKEFWLDGVKKSRRQFLEAFLAVVFRPEEIRIVTGSPARRREFLDKVLSPLDWQYRRAVLAYEKALRRRNRVLLAISQGEATEQELFYWDQALAKNGEIIRQKREEFLDFANHFFTAGDFVYLSCHYSASPATLDRLRQSLSQDIERGTTSYGPHRDDFSLLNHQFQTEEKSLAFWGSRGQQRLAILALKLAQLAFIEEKKGQQPVLLLDDIFSELDQEGDRLVASLLKDYQALLTSTDELAFSVEANQISLSDF